MGDPIIAGAMIAAVSAGGAWLKSHEQRISAAEEVIKKVDQLVTLMLEERLEKQEPKRGQSH